MYVYICSYTSKKRVCQFVDLLCQMHMTSLNNVHTSNDICSQLLVPLALRVVSKQTQGRVSANYDVLILD